MRSRPNDDDLNPSTGSGSRSAGLLIEILVGLLVVAPACSSRTPPVLSDSGLLDAGNADVSVSGLDAGADAEVCSPGPGGALPWAVTGQTLAVLTGSGE